MYCDAVKADIVDFFFEDGIFIQKISSVSAVVVAWYSLWKKKITASLNDKYIYVPHLIEKKNLTWM